MLEVIDQNQYQVAAAFVAAWVCYHWSLHAGPQDEEAWLCAQFQAGI